MKLLLDTHAVIWFTEDAPQLPPRAAGAIEDAGNTVLLSAVVAWEIAIKRALGKLVPNSCIEVMLGAGCEELPITLAHAQAVESLPDHHNDPFDRLLIAQAMSEEATIVTGDQRIHDYDVSTLW